VVKNDKDSDDQKKKSTQIIFELKLLPDQSKAKLE
jgi:hypothetical protein